MTTIRPMEPGSDYLPKGNRANPSSCPRPALLGLDSITSSYARELDKNKFNKFRIKSRAFHVIVRRLIYIQFIHVMILYVRIVRRIFPRLKKFVKFAKNNLKLFYLN